MLKVNSSMTMCPLNIFSGVPLRQELISIVSGPFKYNHVHVEMAFLEVSRKLFTSIVCRQ